MYSLSQGLHAILAMTCYGHRVISDNHLFVKIAINDVDLPSFIPETETACHDATNKGVTQRFCQNHRDGVTKGL